MIELRRKRIDSLGGALPPVMWGIMLIGAILSVTVTYLLKIDTADPGDAHGVPRDLHRAGGVRDGGTRQPAHAGRWPSSPTAYQVVQDRLINLK